jgi:pimeloyl-ACP methyl ester carboxylesterase
MGVRVIAPALPGYGGTAPLPDGRVSLAAYADWVLDFLDAVELEKQVLLVGHSFGGGVATLATLERPGRVGALVLVNSIGGAAVTPDGQLVTPVARRLFGWGIHFARDAHGPARLARVLPIVVSDMLPNLLRSPRTFLRSANAARQADLGPELARLAKRRVPVVVLWGRRDHVIGDEPFEVLCDTLGRDAAITVPGGHNWLLADPRHFGEVMTNVLDVAERARWFSRRGGLRGWWERRRWRRTGVRRRPHLASGGSEARGSDRGR